MSSKAAKFRRHFECGDRPAGLSANAPSAGRLPDVRRRGRYRAAHVNAPGRDRVCELLPVLRASGRGRQNTPRNALAGPWCAAEGWR